jgi:integral membrane sensor domain MASE1
MKKIHLVIGTLTIIIFLLTGQYMHHVYNHLQNMADAPRMMYRATHIYILLSGIINLTLGVYLVLPKQGLKRYIQLLISALILVAPPLLIAGFFYDLKSLESPRAFTRIALYLLFGSGVLLFLLSFFKSDDK